MAAFPLGGNFMPPNLAATQLLMQASTSNPKDMPPVSMASLMRLPSIPDLPHLPQAYLPAHIAAFNTAAFTDPRLLYSALSGAYMGNPDMKDGHDAMAAWRNIAAQANAAAAMGGAPMAPYESHNMAPGAGFPSPGYAAIDLNGTRRKNATRETTSTLKAWLYEHRKNPYPNKGEKIMLAIMTKMTLTQVSTWFANARRRLKKENKMTWSPRNRTEDGSDDGEDKGDNENVDDDLSIDLSDFDTEGKQESSDELKLQRTVLERQKSVASSTEGPVSPDKEPKPKIWSLADVAANPTKHQSIHSQSIRHKPYHIPSQNPNPATFRPWFEAQQVLNRQINPAAFAALHSQLNPAFMMTARPTAPHIKPEHFRQAGSPESTGSTHRPSTTSPQSSAYMQRDRPVSLSVTTQSQIEDRSTKE